MVAVVGSKRHAGVEHFVIRRPDRTLALVPAWMGCTRLSCSMFSSYDAFRVPDDSLVLRGGDAYVPMVHQDRIHLAKVILGNDNGRTVEVAHAVPAGSLIALNVGGWRRGRRPGATGHGRRPHKLRMRMGARGTMNSVKSLRTSSVRQLASALRCRRRRGA